MSQSIQQRLPFPDFTIDGYTSLLKLLRDNGYSYADYGSWQGFDKPVIMRHDIDYDIKRSYDLAKLEFSFEAPSTYFVLVRSGMYNCASFENTAMLKEIASMGHRIGLHFDETVYSEGVDMVLAISREAEILSEIVGSKIESVSMHRPSRACLDENWVIPNLVNSYDDVFFKSPFKYISDSRRCWREPVLDVVSSGKYSHLHILTHAFWYRGKNQKLGSTLREFIDSAIDERYMMLSKNFTDLDKALEEANESE